MKRITTGRKITCSTDVIDDMTNLDKNCIMTAHVASDYRISAMSPDLH